MIAFLKRLWRDPRGNVLLIAAAALPLVVASAGLATDTIQWTLWKRQLQRAADSAALAGAYHRQSVAGAQTGTPQAVSHDLTLNLHTGFALSTGYPLLNYPPNAGLLSNQVAVTLVAEKRLPFSSMFMAAPPQITARATAAVVEAGGDPCVFAMEPDANKTGITAGGNTTVHMPDCVMYSLSPSSNSASAGGSSTVTAQAIAAVGGIQQSNNWSVGAYRPYSPPLPDPFANLNPDPTQMNCTTATLDHNTDFSTLPAGTNCFASLSVGSNRTVNIPANFGPIYINGGNANFQGTFNCTGCTIVLTNTSTASNATIGTLSSNASAQTNITAPTSGTWTGVAIYQDRRASDCSGCNKVNGGSTSVVTGALYFPKQELWFNGGAGPTATCTMLVARRIVLTGNSKFKGLSQCTGEGLPNSTVFMVRLVA